MPVKHNTTSISSIIHGTLTISKAFHNTTQVFGSTAKTWHTIFSGEKWLDREIDPTVLSQQAIENANGSTKVRITGTWYCYYIEQDELTDYGEVTLTYKSTETGFLESDSGYGSYLGHTSIEFQVNNDKITACFTDMSEGQYGVMVFCITKIEGYY